MRRKSSSQKGASLVEFALVLPLLMLILLGMIEFGLLLYNKQVITNASREGAGQESSHKTPVLLIVRLLAWLIVIAPLIWLHSGAAASALPQIQRRQYSFVRRPL